MITYFYKILDPNKSEQINYQKKFIKSNEIKNRFNKTLLTMNWSMNQ